MLINALLSKILNEKSIVERFDENICRKQKGLMYKPRQIYWSLQTRFITAAETLFTLEHFYKRI